VPHYFMHLIDGRDMLLDPDGAEGQADAVGRVALAAARDCMCGALGTDSSAFAIVSMSTTRAGKSCTACRSLKRLMCSRPTNGSAIGFRTS
jgi:hypothetical protein